MNKDRRVAFIFNSSREDVFEQIKRGETSDSPLRGMNYIPGSGYFTIPSQKIKAVLFIPRLLRQDFVISQDNLMLGCIVSYLSRILRRPTKWIHVAITSSTLIRRNTRRPLHLFLLKTFWKSYAHIVCISSEQMNDFIRIGVPRSRLTFIPYCIGTDFFRPPQVAPNGENIASVGRDAGRDYPTLFKTAEKVPHTWTVAAARRNIPADSVIPSNVKIHYDASAVEVRDLFRKARLLVIISKDPNIPVGSDCCGQTVVLEGMAAGLPVIATERSWMMDYFTPGKHLIIVKSDDPEGIARAINDIWNDDARRKELAQAGYAVVNEKYTTKVMAEQFERLMDSLS